TAVWVSSAYPLAGIFLLGSTFSTIVGWRTKHWLSWERLIALSLGVYGVGLIGSPLFRVYADYEAFNAWAIAFSMVFLLGHYLMFLAALYRLSSHAPWALRPAPAFRRSSHAGLSVILPVVFLGMGAMSWLIASDVTQPSSMRNLAWFGAGAMALGLSVRGIALVFENGRLHESSITDPLTGLFDRRQFFVSIATEVEAAQRYGDPVGLVVLNIDGFGVVNNRLGARSADAVLCEIARSIKRAAGRENMAFRLGGDDFAVILPGATAPLARETAHRIRGAVLLVDTKCDLRLTASVGFAVFPEDALDHVELTRRADAAQYHAKTHGRDQIVRFDPDRAFDHGPKERAERLTNESHLSTVRALAAAVDARDAATQFHSRNVARLCVR
ncbi:GGDEF domain-containing protein, partial [bacterium]|nr:GGDEF domain-containing protein [bacterium]